MEERKGKNQFQIWMLLIIQLFVNYIGFQILIPLKFMPQNPTSVWPGMAKSQKPTLSALQHDIKENSCIIWNQIDDELDKNNYTNLKESLINNKKVFWDENI